MKTGKMSAHYQRLREQYTDFFAALESTGKAARKAGPLDAKTAHLVQLAAAAAIRSEGAVHSHVRRALEQGATAEEIRHAILLLASTVGFPAVGAALSWADDILSKTT